MNRGKQGCIGALLLAAVVSASACGLMRSDVPPPIPARPKDRLIMWAGGDPEDGPPPLTVQFTCESLIDEEQPTAYQWDFGDGSAVSREQKPRHTFTRPGMYVVRLIAWDDQGHAGEDTVRIDVEADE